MFPGPEGGSCSSFPCGSAGKESAHNAGDPGFDSWVGKVPWRRERLPTPVFLGFPCGSAGKESACNAGDPGFHPWVGKIPWRRERLPTSVFWPAGFHGLYSPGGCKESDMIEWLSHSPRPSLPPPCSSPSLGPLSPPSAGAPVPLPAALSRPLRVPVPTGVSERKAAGPHLQLPGQPGCRAVLRQLAV